MPPRTLRALGHLDREKVIPITLTKLMSRPHLATYNSQCLKRVNFSVYDGTLTATTSSMILLMSRDLLPHWNPRRKMWSAPSEDSMTRSDSSHLSSSPSRSSFRSYVSMGWDETLSDELLQEWKSSVADLQKGKPVAIPRCYLVGLEEDNITYGLCGFCDASSKGRPSPDADDPKTRAPISTPSV